VLTGRTVTKQLKIEARQYDLFGLDLGDGVVRSRAALGALAFVLWIALSAPLTIGTGLMEVRPDLGSLIILFPPSAAIMLGFRDDDEVPQRMRITGLALGVRQLLFPRGPIIGLGVRSATRAERSTLRERATSARESRDADQPVQAPIRRHVRARLIGNEEQYRLITNTKERTK